MRMMKAFIAQLGDRFFRELDPNPDKPEPYRVFDSRFCWFAGICMVTISKLRAIPNVRFSL